jgi:hypothetical protein
VDGITYPVDEVHPMGVLVDPSDASTIRVLMATASGSSATCNRLRPTVRLVTQDENSVVSAAFDYALASTGGHEVCLGIVQLSSGSSTGSTFGYVQKGIRLAAPLRSRRIYDAQDGSLAPVLDPSYVPKPPYVPPRFTQRWVTPIDGRTSVGAMRQYRDAGDANLEVSVNYSDRRGIDPIVGDVDVAGYDAAITDRDGRCVSWTNANGLANSVCSFGRSPLSSDVLVKVARSVR